MNKKMGGKEIETRGLEQFVWILNERFESGDEIGLQGLDRKIEWE
jgi:predicted deacetylase